MTLMADPIIALRELQKAVDIAPPVDSYEANGGYFNLFDVRPDGGKRYSYAKIINAEVQAISIFGLEDTIDGLARFSIGYAVSERHRGRGLAVEAINKGLENLKKEFKQLKTEKFYIEAVIDIENIYSIKVAQKLFLNNPTKIIEVYSGRPAHHFKKLVLT